ncbi:MAG: hypothetical protein LBT31_09285 [Synergistaceae bacterium]|jgi:chaperonin cofactor prefoldin|nr:hypothetical protein [Synergistaceae bacterium]
MRTSETNGASDIAAASAASGGTAGAISLVNLIAAADRINTQSIELGEQQYEGGAGLSASLRESARQWNRYEAVGYEVSAKLEVIDMRVNECMKRMDATTEHTRELTRALVEAFRNETALLIENNREKTELLIDTNRNETILKIEASMRETELLIRSIKESTERTEARFRDDNEKAEGRIERLAREIKDSNNRIHGYTLANVIGFASILIAITILVWSIKTIEIKTPSVNINQAIPPAPLAQTSTE